MYSFKFSETDDFNEFALFVSGCEGAEEKDYDHSEAKDVGAVVIAFRGGLLWRAE